MSSASSLNSLLSSSSSQGSTQSSIDISSLLAAATGATSTGIDVTSAVDAAIYAAQAPERVWQTEQSTLQSQMSALSSIQTALSSISNDLTSLEDPAGALSATTVSSSNSSVITAATSAGASVGTHAVVVNSIASAASWYLSPLSSSASSLGSSALTISTGTGNPSTFSLGTNGITSLASLASAINSAAIGVNASVVTDATGSRLALVAATTGSAANFSIADAPVTSAAWNSADVASASTLLPASSFAVGDGSSSQTFTVTAGSTLADVANQINGSGLNLSASVVLDPSGAHLSIVAGGSGNATVTGDPTFLSTQSSMGSDASLVIDGIPVTSHTNVITGAISGTTLNLVGASGGAPITLTTSADANQISSEVSQFVTDYNSLSSLLTSQFTFSSSSGSEGVLGSDATIRSLQSSILAIGAYEAPSTNVSGSSSISNLADLGITMNDDGSLTLNSSTLNQAISENAGGVLSFFQGTGLNGFVESVTSQLQSFTDLTSEGALTADMTSMTAQYNDLQTDINDFETDYIAPQRSVLNTMYSNAEIALQQLPTQMKELQAQLGNGNGS